MKTVAAAIAIAIGLLVVLGAFLPVPLLRVIRVELVQWAAVLAGVAVLVGVTNLFSVHVRKVRRKEKNGLYSLVLLVSLVGALLLGLAFGPDDPLMIMTVNAIILPVEASLMALLAITLVYAAMRLLHRRSDLMTIIFLATAVLVMLASAPLPGIGTLPVIGDLLRPFITQVLASAGARGVLLGVALGTLTTGLRVLFGADRPYGGN